MKRQCAEWNYASPRIRTLLLAGVAIVALASVATAGGRELDVSGVPGIRCSLPRRKATRLGPLANANCRDVAVKYAPAPTKM
jgi:hypothetical protein